MPASTPEKAEENPISPDGGPAASVADPFALVFEQAIDHFTTPQAPIVKTGKVSANPAEPAEHSNGKAIGDAAPAPLQTPKQNPLPYTIAFTLPLPTSTNAGASSLQGGRSQDSTALRSGSLEVPPSNPQPALSLTSHSAFTAQIKLPDQTSFELPAATPAAVPASAVGANQTKSEYLQPAPDPVAANALRSKAGTADSAANHPAPVDSPAPSASAALSSTPAVTPATPSAIPATAIAPAKVAPLQPIQVVETTAKPATPMQEITFQLPGARGVEVKLTERAGEVRVDVRSGDTALTQELRGSLHELVSNLERKGLSAEISHPAGTPEFRAGESQPSKDSSSSQGNGSHQQDEPQERRQTGTTYLDGRSKKERTHAWNEVFDSYSQTRD